MHSFFPLIGIVPFVLLFSLLTFTRWKTWAVTLGVMLLTAVLAVFVWKMGALSAFSATGEGVFLALLPIVWVIFAAVFTYFVGVETGAMETVKTFLTKITPDRNLQAVVIAFCFGGFLESIAGFGTAVAIPTAMLMALGFNPVRAAVISLVANSVPVAFGALGIPVIVLARITGLDLHLLTQYIVFQLLPFAVLVPAALVLISSGSLKESLKSLPGALFIGAVFTLIQTATGLLLGPELVAVLASLGSLVLFTAWRRLRSGVRIIPNGKALAVALVNYGVLLLLVVLTRLVFADLLKSAPFTIAFSIGEHHEKLEWLSTPGTLLLISALVGGLVQGAAWKDLGRVAWETLYRIRWSAFTIVNIVVLAKIMGYSGIIGSVAGGLAAVSGKFFPLIAPLLGALGTFVTGSDTSSNILLGELQKSTAIATGYSPEWIAASNTAGATAGKMISPQSISVAASTVGIGSREREILRGTVLWCLGYVLILGIYVFIAARFFIRG